MFLLYCCVLHDGICSYRLFLALSLFWDVFIFCPRLQIKFPSGIIKWLCIFLAQTFIPYLYYYAGWEPFRNDSRGYIQHHVLKHGTVDQAAVSDAIKGLFAAEVWSRPFFFFFSRWHHQQVHSPINWHKLLVFYMASSYNSPYWQPSVGSVKACNFLSHPLLSSLMGWGFFFFLELRG